MNKQTKFMLSKTNRILFLLLLFWQIFTIGHSQNIARLAVYENNQKRAYLEYLPSNYETSNEKIPVIIFLHGSGEKGDYTDTLDVRSIENVSFTCPPTLIKNGHDMCFTVNGKTKCFAVFCPQTNSSWAYGDKFNYVEPFVEYILNTYPNLDPESVFLTGFSLGANGTWEAAYSPFNMPQRFAAIAPVSGTGDATSACRLGEEGIGAWAFHGTNDYYTVYMGHRPILGMGCVPTPDTTFTVYDGATHTQVPGYAYRADHSVHSPNLYEWFLLHSRTPKDTIPVAPGNLNAAAISNSEILLTWNDNSSTETGFKIERSNTTTGTYELIQTTNANTTNFTDNNLTENTNYCYRVKSFNAFGSSPYSNVDSATTVHQAVDTIIIDNTNSQTVISGSWIISTAGGSLKYGYNYFHDGNANQGTKSVTFQTNKASGRYEVFAWWYAYSNRATNTPFYIHHANGTSVVIQNQQINGGEWVSLGIYDFTAPAQVVVRNDSTNGYVIADAIRLVKVPELPSAPTNLTATTVSNTAIDLAWIDNSDNETGFEIERAISNTGPYDLIRIVPGNKTSYSDTGLIALTSYSYRIRSINAGGKSDYSNVDSAYTYISQMNSYIMDNLSDGVTVYGDWTISTAGETEKYGINYLHDGNTDKISKRVSFVANVATGNYEVFAWWFAYPNRSTNTPFFIVHQNGTTKVVKNQQTDGGKWVSLGVYSFSNTAEIIISSDSTNGYVVADAIKLEEVTSLKNSTETETNLSANPKVRAFPNPVKDKLHIELNDFIEGNVVIRLTDMSGRVEWTGSYAPGSSIDIDVKELHITPGFKILSVIAPNQLPATKKISIVR